MSSPSATITSVVSFAPPGTPGTPGDYGPEYARCAAEITRLIVEREAVQEDHRLGLAPYATFLAAVEHMPREEREAMVCDPAEHAAFMLDCLQRRAGGDSDEAKELTLKIKAVRREASKAYYEWATRDPEASPSEASDDTAKAPEA